MDMFKNDDAPDMVVAKLKESGVKYGLASFVDLHGISKAKAVPIAHLQQMLGGSEMFTGAALDGVPQGVNEDEVNALPDTASGLILPWNREVAWFASDLYLNGTPFEACSRNILRRALKEATDMGFRFNLGIETEFFIFRRTSDGAFHPMSERDTLDKSAYDVRTLLDYYPIIDEIVSAMNELGWDVYSFDHEDGTGQFETDFAFTDALEMADRFTFFRYMVNEIARKHDAVVCFMPKPMTDRTGSAAHFNMSFADPETGVNLFEAPNDPRGCGLSTLGYQFIAGALRHAKAICAVAAPLVNSYKRLVIQGSMSGFTWAPIYICYGGNNRTNMFRIPSQGNRVECRAPDISCNVYLAAAMMLRAGLEGIREELDPGEPHFENMYERSPEELSELNIDVLPRTLLEAVEEFSADPLSPKVFGQSMYDAFVNFKRGEWNEYHNHVSDWERERYGTMF
jgi:glutamine synthetase